MSARIGRYANFSALALLFLIVLMALATTAARLMLPVVADYRHWFEDQLAAAVGQPVHIGDVHARLVGFSPRLYFREVQLLSPRSSQPLIEFPEASLSLDVAESLIYGKPRLSRLTLSGAELHILRDTDGTVRLLGTFGAPHHDIREVLAWLNTVSLSLYADRLRIEDRKLGVDYTFLSASAHLASRGSHHQLFTEMYPQGGVADALRVALDFRGNLADPALWKGDFYTWVADLDPTRLPWPAAMPEVAGGRVGTEIWGHWGGEQLINVKGVLDLHALELAYPGYLSDSGRVSHEYDMRTEFQYSRDGDRDELYVRDARGSAQTEPGGQVHVEFLREADGSPRSLRGHAAAMDMAAIAPVVAQWLSTRAPAATRMADALYAGRADQIDFHVAWKDHAVQAYGAKGHVTHLGMQPVDKLPGGMVSGLGFELSESGGRAVIDGGPGQLDWPRWYDDSLPLDDARAVLEWKPRAGGGYILYANDIQGANADLAAAGDLRAWLGQGEPLMAADLNIGRLQLPTVTRYLPRDKVNPKLKSWLETALLAGVASEGSISFSGPFLHFPFRLHDGHVDARMTLNHVNLDYRPGWPMLNDVNGGFAFHDGTLTGDIRQARVLNSAATDGKLAISSVFEPVLDLSIATDGPVADALTYLKGAGLIRPENRQLNLLEADGSARLSVQVRQSLSAAVPVRTEVRGAVKLSRTRLEFKGLGQRFDDVEGSAVFGPEGGRAQNVSARWRGQPLKVAATPTLSTGTDVDIQGRLTAASLLQGFHHPLFEAIDGASDWHVRLSLPGFGVEHRGEPVRLAMASQLEGVSVSLPPPLGKLASDLRSLSMSASFGDKPKPIALRYGDGFSAALEVSPDGRGLTRAGFQFGAGTAALPPSGMSVSGNLDRWSYDAWRPHLWPDKPAAGPERPDESSLLRTIDVYAGLVDLGGYTLDKLRLRATRVQQRWQADVLAPSVEGHIDAPLSFRHNEQISAVLKRLSIEQPAADAAADAPRSYRKLDPRELPGLDLSSDVFRWGPHEFSDLKLQVLPAQDGLDIATLRLNATSFEARVHGSWLVDGKGSTTHVQGTLKSDDLGKTLKSLKISHALKEGSGSLSFKLGWPGEPQAFSLATATGDGHITIEDGSMRHIEPGPGRLLSLMNLEGTLRRRLTLNFGDVLSSGFSFDKVDGDLQLGQGNLSTDKLSVVAPSADVSIKGRVGLIARDYDQDILITPKLTSGLPVVGLVLGGPAVGAVMFVTDKILNQLGNGINGLTNIRYSVTGPWDEPVIKGTPAPGFGG